MIINIQDIFNIAIEEAFYNEDVLYHMCTAVELMSDNLIISVDRRKEVLAEISEFIQNCYSFHRYLVDLGVKDCEEYTLSFRKNVYQNWEHRHTLLANYLKENNIHDR